MNAITRDEMIFGKYEPEKYSGGCRRFTCDRTLLKKLVENGYADPREQQNESPTIKEFIEYTEDFEDAEFECYAISPKRIDCRITVEGIDIKVHEDEYDKVSYLVETFRWADEFSFEHIRHDYYLHAWWD